MNEKKSPAGRRIARLAASATATVGLALAGAVGLGAPAFADGLSSCPTSYVCVWEDLNYETNGNYLGWFQVYTSDSNLDGNEYAGTTVNVHDSITSVYNKANTESAAFFHLSSAGGGYFIRSAGAMDGDLSNNLGVPSGFNDSVSSIYYCGYTSAC